MKKLSVILTTSVILVLTMIFITNTPAQDTNPRIYMDNADQSWPSISGLIIAHHDLPIEPDPWDNLDIYEISDFIDESIKNGTLLGYGSGSLADKRLNILKDKIDTAANILESGTFEEACQYLLDAYLSTDGLGQTPDLVYGQAASELAKKIKLMRVEIIGCE
ncbi:MAG: hypothetical protein PVF56_05755 [Desulfobacterales bacterium]